MKESEGSIPQGDSVFADARMMLLAARLNGLASNGMLPSLRRRYSSALLCRIDAARFRRAPQLNLCTFFLFFLFLRVRFVQFSLWWWCTNWLHKGQLNGVLKIRAFQSLPFSFFVFACAFWDFSFSFCESDWSLNGKGNRSYMHVVFKISDFVVLF